MIVIMAGNTLQGDCHHFPALKRNLGRQKFEDSCNTAVGDTGCGLILVGNVKLVALGDKYFICGREMQWDSSRAESELFFLQRTINNPKLLHCTVIFRPTLLCVFVCLCL